MTTDTRGAVTLHWRCSEANVNDFDSVDMVLWVSSKIIPSYEPA